MWYAGEVTMDWMVGIRFPTRAYIFLFRTCVFRSDTSPSTLGLFLEGCSGWSMNLLLMALSRLLEALTLPYMPSWQCTRLGPEYIFSFTLVPSWVPSTDMSAHGSLPLGPILGQFNADHTIITHLPKTDVAQDSDQGKALMYTVMNPGVP
jgi:hypothetical protein